MIFAVNSTCRCSYVAAGRVHGGNHCSTFSTPEAFLECTLIEKRCPVPWLWNILGENFGLISEASRELGRSRRGKRSSRRRGRMSGALSGVAETCQPVNRSTSKRVNQETSQSEPVNQETKNKIGFYSRERVYRYINRVIH